MLLTLKSIETWNFMAHRHEKVEFPAQGIFLLWGPSGAGKCLPASSRVFDAERGEAVSIKTFVEERRRSLVGWTEGEAKPVDVVDWMSLGEKPVVKIRLADGHEILAAETHPILTDRGCVRAGDLASDDFVGRARQTPAISQSAVTTDEAHLLGLLLGDGTLTTGMALTAKPKETVALYQRLVESIFPGATISSAKRKSEAATYPVVNVATGGARAKQIVATREKLLAAGVRRDSNWALRGGREAGMSLQSLRRFEDQYGLDLFEDRCRLWASASAADWLDGLGLLGTNSFTKFIPSNLLFMDEPQAAALVSGLWQADGHVGDGVNEGKGVELSYATRSRQLADDVRILLSRLGVATTLRRKTIKGAPMFEVAVIASSKLRLLKYLDLVGEKAVRARRVRRRLLETVPNGNADMIPPRLAKPYRSGKEMKTAGMDRWTYLRRGGDDEVANTVWSKVVSVEPAGVEECYDVEVDTPEHLYLADGFIVHNSSYLEAIGFALYGVTGTRYRKIDELRHELYPNADFGVQVVYRIGDGDEEIEIFRGVKNSRSQVWLTEPGSPTVDKPKAVTERISQIMGSMDGATFFATYFSQQNELASLTNMTGALRRKFIQRMLGVSVLDRVNKRIKAQVDKANTQIAYYDGALPEESEAELEAMLAAAQADERALADELGVQNMELEAATVALAGARERLDASRAERERAAALTPQIATLRENAIPSLEERLQAADAQIADARAAADRVQASGDLGEQVAALQAEAEKLSAAEGAVAALRNLQRRAVEAQARVNAAQAKLDALPVPADAGDPAPLRTERERLLATWKLIGVQLDELSANRARLLDAGECYTCLRELGAGDDRDRALAQLTAREAELQAQREQVKAQGADVAAQLRAAEQAETARLQRERDSARLQAELSSAQAEHGRVSAEYEQSSQDALGADAARLETVRRELQAKATAAAELRADNALAARLGELEAAHAQRAAELRAAKAQLADAAAELAGLSLDLDAAQQLERDFSARQATHADLRERVATVTGRHQAAEKVVRDREAALSRYAQTVADRKKAADKHMMLTRLDGSVKDFRSYLIKQIRPRLQTLTSQHLSSLTEGRMPAVAISEDYELAISRNGAFRALHGCSGGEQARAAFSMRLALTQLVSERTDTPVGFMVFDEIFGSQDAGHRQAILEALRYLRGVYPQTFLISHEESLRDSELIDLILEVPESTAEDRIVVVDR